MGRRRTRNLIWQALILLLFSVLLPCGVAHADIGGQIPAPGLCEYPGTGESGMTGVMVAAYWYYCDFPVELNGSHWHCQYLGAATQGNLGFSMMLQAGIAGPVGGLIGGCHFVCPSGELAGAPNPPGGWRDGIIPTKCRPIGPNPDEPRPAQEVPIEPPIAEQGAVPQVPFRPGAPVPPPPPPPFVEATPPAVPGDTDQPVPPPPPADGRSGPSNTGPTIADQSPAQTNPACPNPDSATSEQC